MGILPGWSTLGDEKLKAAQFMSVMADWKQGRGMMAAANFDRAGAQKLVDEAKGSFWNYGFADPTTPVAPWAQHNYAGPPQNLAEAFGINAQTSAIRNQAAAGNFASGEMSGEGSAYGAEAAMDAGMKDLTRKFGNNLGSNSYGTNSPLPSAPTIPGVAPGGIALPANKGIVDCVKQRADDAAKLKGGAPTADAAPQDNLVAWAKHFGMPESVAHEPMVADMISKLAAKELRNLRAEQQLKDMRIPGRSSTASVDWGDPGKLIPGGKIDPSPYLHWGGKVGTVKTGDPIKDMGLQEIPNVSKSGNEQETKYGAGAINGQRPNPDDDAAIWKASNDRPANWKSTTQLGQEFRPDTPLDKMTDAQIEQMWASDPAAREADSALWRKLQQMQEVYDPAPLASIHQQLSDVPSTPPIRYDRHGMQAYSDVRYQNDPRFQPRHGTIPGRMLPLPVNVPAPEMPMYGGLEMREAFMPKALQYAFAGGDSELIPTTGYSGVVNGSTTAAQKPRSFPVRALGAIDALTLYKLQRALRRNK